MGKGLIVKQLLAAGGALALLAAPAYAEPEYVSIEMAIDVDAPAETLWERVGGWCAIGDWANLPCEVTSGDGDMGSVRVLTAGPNTITEILVAQTPLSYGYTQPVIEGQFYNLYHGFMEARPASTSSSQLLYTLVYDVSNLDDQAAKDADMDRRRGMFEGFLENMKAIAEAE